MQEYNNEIVLWSDDNSLEWIRILSLPCLPWVEPFLPYMGLPHQMVSSPKIWCEPYRKAMLNYEERLRTKDWQVGRSGGRSLLIRQVLGQAFQSMIQDNGQEVAIELERWVHQHFFSSSIRDASSIWSGILSRTLPYSTARRRIPPPEQLTAKFLAIPELVGFEHKYNIYRKVEEVAPPAPITKCPDEKLRYCFEGTMLHYVITQASVLETLQKLAQTLNEEEHTAFIAWAKIQAQAISKYGLGRLHEEEYFVVQSKCCNFSLVLSLKE
jgi:hypothetical protein